MFRDILSKAESFSLFQESLDTACATSVAFFGQRQSPAGYSPSHRHSGHNNRGRGRGRGGQRRRPRCQICRQDGHYADACDQRYHRSSGTTTHLAEVFSAGCSTNLIDASDWFIDTARSLT